MPGRTKSQAVVDGAIDDSHSSAQKMPQASDDADDAMIDSGEAHEEDEEEEEDELPKVKIVCLAPP